MGRNLRFHSRFFFYMEVQARNRFPQESRVPEEIPGLSWGTLGNFYVRRWSYIPTKKMTGISPEKDGRGTSILEGPLRARTSCLIPGSVLILARTNLCKVIVPVGGYHSEVSSVA